MLHPRVTGAFRALRSYGLLAALIAMGLALAVTAPGFASVGNGADMLRDLAILGIMAVGETLVIIGGGIDLSVGSILMLAGILSDNLVRGLHFGPFVAVPLVLAARSEEHTSELQSLAYLVCRLLLEKKKKI